MEKFFIMNKEDYKIEMDYLFFGASFQSLLTLFVETLSYIQLYEAFELLKYSNFFFLSLGQKSLLNFE